MPPKRLAIVLVALGLASLAGGSENARACPEGTASVTSVTAEARRRYTYLLVEGQAAGAPGARIRVRRKGDAGGPTALEQPIASADGAFRVEVRSTKRLLPGEYELEVVAGDQRLASSPFRLGTPAEEGPARERLRGWLVGARRTFRELASFVDRQGVYHANQILEDAATNGGMPSAAVVDAQRAAYATALERFSARCRTARMDFSIYEREVALTPFPETTAALARLFELYPKRQKELAVVIEAATRGKRDAVPEAREILAAARQTATELGLSPDADAAAWGAGILGAPEKLASANGSLESPLGFAVTPPEGWTVVPTRLSPSDDPTERLTLEGPDKIKAVVRIRDTPDATKADDLRDLIEVASWEEWGGNAYKRHEYGPLPGEGFAYKIVSQINPAAGESRRLVELERASKDFGRLYGIIVIVPEAVWVHRRPEVERLAASFRLTEPAK